jgi:FixJ family two-component response regulator
MNYQVLIVDDELMVGKSLIRLLKQHNISAMHAVSADECLEVLNSQEFKIAIVDQNMPGLQGTELLKRLRNFYPDIIRIMLTGVKDIDLIYQAVNETGVFRFFFKPWDDKELVQAIFQAIRMYDLAENNRRLTDELSRKNIELEAKGLSMDRALKSQIQSEQRLQALLDSLPLGVLLFNQSEKIIEHNDLFGDWFNSSHSLVGMQLDEIPDEIYRYAENPGLHTVLYKDRPFEVYVTSVAIDDELHWVLAANDMAGQI